MRRVGEVMFVNQYAYCAKKIETQYIEICPNVLIQLTIDAQREMRRDRLSLYQLLEILKRGEFWVNPKINRGIFLTRREGLGVTAEYREIPLHGYIVSITGVKPIGAWIPPSADWRLVASRNRTRNFSYKSFISVVRNGICESMTVDEWMNNLIGEQNIRVP